MYRNISRACTVIAADYDTIWKLIYNGVNVHTKASERQIKFWLTIWIKNQPAIQPCNFWIYCYHKSQLEWWLVHIIKWNLSRLHFKVWNIICINQQVQLSRVHITGADLGGPRGAVPPSKIFNYMLLLLLTAWKLHSMMFNHY